MEEKKYTPWNKYFYALLATVALIFGVNYCAPASAASLAELPQMQKEMFTPSIQLGGFCSGTIIHSKRDDKTGDVSTIALTAKHCVEKVDQRIPVNVSNYNDKNREVSKTVYNTKVFGVSYKSDLALLRFDDKSTFFPDVAKIAALETKLTFGQDVYSVSFPLGGSKTLTVGALGYVEVNDFFKTYSTSTEFYRSTPDIGPASSGSGLFIKTDKGYELVGTLTGGYRAFTFMNLYTPLEEINEYLEVAKKTF